MTFFSADSTPDPAPAGDIVRVRVLISGRVQGVGYRAATEDMARRLGICGWVRNLPDGRVEAVFEAPGDRTEAAIAWCHRGSSPAVVSSVEVQEESPEGLQGFQIRRS